MNNLKAVVFDMDGVLLDTESMSDKTWIQAAKEMNMQHIEKYLNACRGGNRADTIAILQKIYSSVPNFSAERFIERTGEIFHKLENTQGIPLMRGAKEILKFLQGKNYHLALASSTQGEDVRRQLKNTGLIDFFESIVTGDTVTHSKPDPEIYIKACESLSCIPEECAAIEDSLNGVKSACTAGLHCIMIPDMVQPTEEIKAIVWKICASLDDAQKLF